MKIFECDCPIHPWLRHYISWLSDIHNSALLPTISRGSSTRPTHPAKSLELSTNIDTNNTINIINTSNININTNSEGVTSKALLSSPLS